MSRTPRVQWVYSGKKVREYKIVAYEAWRAFVFGLPCNVKPSFFRIHASKINECCFIEGAV